MNYFENQIMRSGMTDSIDIPWAFADEVCRLRRDDPGCRLALTAKIDVSAANNVLARIRREERERIEAEIRQYVTPRFVKSGTKSCSANQKAMIF